MVLLMVAAGVAASGICAKLGSGKAGDSIAIMLESVLFLVIFVMGLEMYRLKKGWFHEKSNNYVRIAACHSCCCLGMILCMQLPAYAAPIMVLAAVMTIVTNSFLGMMAGIYYVAVLYISGKGNIYQLLWALLLVSCGCMIVDFLEKKTNRKWAAVVITFFVIGCTIVFSYWETGNINPNMVIYGLGNGIVSAGLSIGIYHWLTERMSHTREDELERIISEEFGMVQDVKKFSKADYEHARRVSDIARECAKVVGADPYVAAAGGFYYRIGRMEGEPYVENGVILAKSNYFPMQVVQILSEYNGEKKLPSTVESAIVHIVDSVVAKFDVLDKNTLSSSWNQDILVYQTLNENSAEGLYDKAGFSMNMFLKIRDYLIKEAELL